MPGLTHCVAGRFGIALGGGPACSWTHVHSRSRISRLTLTKALPTYLRVPGSAIIANAGLPLSRSTPRSSNSLSVKDFVFSQLKHSAQLIRCRTSRTTIGIGGNLAVPPLPHHPAYGSVQGGSADYAALAGTTEARPMLARKAFGRAMASAGLLLMRHGPCGLPAVCAARS